MVQLQSRLQHTVAFHLYQQLPLIIALGCIKVQQWKRELLQPENVGVKADRWEMLPIQTDMSPAHKSLLEVIRCNINCRVNGSTQRCTCKTDSFQLLVHGACKGLSWTNLATPDLEAGPKDD